MASPFSDPQELEIHLNIWKQYRLLPPNTILSTYWAEFILLLVQYNMFFLPLDLSFRCGELRYTFCERPATAFWCDLAVLHRLYQPSCFTVRRTGTNVTLDPLHHETSTLKPVRNILSPIDYVIEVFFLVDIIMTFRTAYVVEESQVYTLDSHICTFAQIPCRTSEASQALPASRY